MYPKAQLLYPATLIFQGPKFPIKKLSLMTILHLDFSLPFLQNDLLVFSTWVSLLTCFSWVYSAFFPKGTGSPYTLLHSCESRFISSFLPCPFIESSPRSKSTFHMDLNFHQGQSPLSPKLSFLHTRSQSLSPPSYSPHAIAKCAATHPKFWLLNF